MKKRRPVDIVWSYKSGNTLLNYIYRDNAYQGSFGSKFLVTVNEYSFSNVSTTLTILSVVESDALYSYECSCSPFGCINQPFRSANASLAILSKMNVNEKD